MDLEGKETKKRRQLQQSYHIYHKVKSQERINSRQVERKMLQYKSNQPGLDNKEVQVLGDMAECEDTKLIAKDLTTKRSTIGSFKNPEKGQDTQLWSKTRINQSNSKQIKQLIQTKTLYKDQEACKTILKNIVNEKEGSELEKNWYQINREKVREQFVKRHEENIKLQNKAGVKTEYEGVSMRNGNNNFQRWNYTTNTFDQEKSEQTIFSINTPGLSVQNKRNSATQKHILVHDIRGQKALFNEQQKINVCSGNVSPGSIQTQTIQFMPTDEDKAKTQVITYRYKDDGQVSPKFNDSPEQHTIEHHPQQFSPKSVFRVRKNKHKRHKSLINDKLQKQVDRLSQPKPEYIPRDPYQYSDFRGLLNADFKDAIVNCFSQEILDKINDETSFSDIIKINKSQNKNLLSMKQSQSDQETRNYASSQNFNVFPVPQSLKSVKLIQSQQNQSPLPTEYNIQYKTKSIMSTDALTKQVFENTGSQGQQIWHSIRELQKSKSIEKVNIFDKKNSSFRPLTAYQQKLNQHKSKTLYQLSSSYETSPFTDANTLSHQYLKNESPGLQNTQSQMSLQSITAKQIAINTENQIYMFEKTHGIGLSNKKPNMYPKKELISHDEILQKYLPSQINSDILFQK